MSYFKQEELKTIKLPSNPDYWVKVPKSLKWREIKQFIAAQQDGEVVIEAQMDTVLIALIREWNLDGPEGKVAEVNESNIGLLDSQDAIHIITESGSIFSGDADEKKG